MGDVSVIIPNYRGEKFIRGCLDSLKEQTFTDFDIIVVDNLSPDDSALIVEREYPEEVHVFELICESLLPILEKWAETCLTSGGVRTYIKADDDREQANILNTLKKGHSFLTNGPILIPTVNGKLPGEKLEEGKELDIDIKLVSNRRLEKLLVCTENSTLKEIELDAKKENGFYDYSLKIKQTITEDRFIYFIAKSDCTNLAISNPVICG